LGFFEAKLSESVPNNYSKRIVRMLAQIGDIGNRGEHS
jgi:hypothetical protein